MTATTIFLVRHGQTEWNVIDQFQGQMNSELTELGRSQARSAVEHLTGQGITRAYSSSLGRALETAEIINESLGLELITSDNLREMSLGPWERVLISEAEKRDPEQFGHFRNTPERFALSGAETFPQLQDRVVSEIYRIAKEHAGEKVLVVSHGIAIKTLLLHLNDQPLSQLRTISTMQNGGHMILEIPASELRST